MQMMTKFAIWMYGTLGLSLLGGTLVGLDMGLSRIQIGQLWFGLLTAMWLSGAVWFAIEAYDARNPHAKLV